MFTIKYHFLTARPPKDRRPREMPTFNGISEYALSELKKLRVPKKKKTDLRPKV